MLTEMPIDAFVISLLFASNGVACPSHVWSISAELITE